MRFVLARHGQTDWNRELRIQGQTDVPLNDTGRVQAKAIAAFCADEGIARICTSDLRRAAETGAIIGEMLRVPTRTDRRLREASFGSLEGLTWEDIPRRHGITRIQMKVDEWDFREFGGEDFHAVTDRTFAFLRELEEDAPEGTCLVISHGRTIWTLLRQLHLAVEFGVPQGLVFMVEYRGGVATLISTTHL